MIFEKLIKLFSSKPDQFRVLEHEPEGRTDVVSQIRGNTLGQAAKAMILMVKLNKKDRKYVLCVVSGEQKIDFSAVNRLFKGMETRFAPLDRATALAGCEMGSVPPLSFHPDLELVVDPRLLENSEIVFNAGRLDRSIFIQTEFYRELARPLVHSISTV